MSDPRQYSFVKFDFDDLPEGYVSQYPFRPNKRYIFFGEIPNMEAHCLVMDGVSGRMYVGYHTDSFIELTEDELDTFEV